MNSDQPRFPFCVEKMPRRCRCHACRLRRAAELRCALERKFGRCRAFPEPRSFAPVRAIRQPLEAVLAR